MTIIGDILGPLSPGSLLGDLGLPSLSDMIHDLELLLMVAVGFLVTVKLFEHALE